MLVGLPESASDSIRLLCAAQAFVHGMLATQSPAVANKSAAKSQQCATAAAVTATLSGTLSRRPTAANATIASNVNAAFTTSPMHTYEYYLSANDAAILGSNNHAPNGSLAALRTTTDLSYNDPTAYMPGTSLRFARFSLRFWQLNRRFESFASFIL